MAAAVDTEVRTIDAL